MTEAPDPFADVAGAIPNAGVSVRGLRILLDDYDRAASPVYLLYYVLNPLEDSCRFRLTVRDQSGKVRASISGLKGRRRAERARERFVASVSELGAEECDAADWQQVLDESVESSRARSRPRPRWLA